MSTAIAAETSSLADVTAIVLGLALMSVGTVALIGGTGMMMWMLGL